MMHGKKLFAVLLPLVLTVPEDVVDMGVDSNGNFVCSGGMRSLPVWTTQPDALCRQGEMMQQQQLQQQTLTMTYISSVLTDLTI